MFSEERTDGTKEDIAEGLERIAAITEWAASRLLPAGARAEGHSY